MLSAVRGGNFEQLRAVFEVTKPDVAVVAEQLALLAGFVTVIRPQTDPLPLPVRCHCNSTWPASHEIVGLMRMPI